MAAGREEPASESETAGGWKRWRDGATKLSMPVLTTVVSAVLVAVFVTSRQDARSQQHARELQTKAEIANAKSQEHARDLQTKAQIANDMSETAVKLIFASETRTKALILGNKSPPSAESASRLKAEFYASSVFIRAKLEAYYKDKTLAPQWYRYTNAVGDFFDLGSVQSAINRGAAQQSPKSQKELLRSIRNGLRGGAQSEAVLDAAVERVNVTGLKPGKERSVYVQNYSTLGGRLIERGAELTKDALD